ncbi:MAG: ChbG/HpnK family deacetylase [Bryobacteraceae bacterium]
MAVGARYRPGMPGRYRNRAASSFYRGNLVLGQTQDDLGIGQNQISQDCFTNLGLGSAPGIDQEPGDQPELSAMSTDFPLNALRAGVPRLKRMTSDALGLMRRRFHRVLERHGCRTTDHFARFQITGRFRTAELVQLLALLPDGSTELMCHPGYCEESLRAAPTRLKESREHELNALTAPETRAAPARNGIELASYLDLE